MSRKGTSKCNVFEGNSKKHFKHFLFTIHPHKHCTKKYYVEIKCIPQGTKKLLLTTAVTERNTEKLYKSHLKIYLESKKTKEKLIHGKSGKSEKYITCLVECLSGKHVQCKHENTSTVSSDSWMNFLA